MKHLPTIVIRSIPHKFQRYETCGDYFKKGGYWNFCVSHLNSDEEFLIIMHELTEWYLCEKKGIREPDIAKFDKMFEKERVAGKWKDEEPGFDPRAPYRLEHKFATQIEKIIANKLKVNWKQYDKHVNSLEQ